MLIYSPNKTTHHIQHAKKVLSRLLENQVKVKVVKYKFHVNMVAIPGDIIGPEGVSMDQGKIAAFTNWSVPTTIKEMQCICFANFYRCLIRGFQHHCLSTDRLFQWASEAFSCLKEAFTIAPILKDSDASTPFIVEIGPSETNVRAILSLSQQSGEKPKLQPVAFFFKKLSPAKRNHGIGNRERLMLKLVLEEWHH